MKRQNKKQKKVFLYLILLIFLVLSCKPDYRKRLAKELANYNYNGDPATPKEMKELERKVAFYSDAVNQQIYAEQNKAYYQEVLGNVYLDYQMYKLAIENLEGALESFPASGGLHNDVALAYHGWGVNQVDPTEKEESFLKAEGHFLLAIHHNPRITEYYQNLGDLYLNDWNKPESLLKVVDDWISYTAKSDTPKFAKAQALTRSGRLKESEALYATLVRTALSKEDKEVAQKNRNKVLQLLEDR